MFELTPEGLVIETTTEIRESINETLRAAFTRSTDLSDGSIQGQTVAIVSERIAQVGELLEAIYAAMDPDAATGAAQDALCALTGTQREAATNSTVTVALTGDNATIIPAGSIISVVDEEDQFETLAEGVLVALDAWVALTPYVVGDRVENAGNAYECIDPGTSAAATGPVSTDPTDTVGETDATVIWRFLGEGEAAIDVEMEAVETGAVVCVAGDMTVIETPVTGWLGAVNMLDADPGSAIETNEALRVRREVELRTPGTGPIDAIRADLLAVDDVTAVTIFENTSDVTDVDGLPPHSVEALVEGGTDQAIWDQLLVSVAAGIATYGDEVGTATDSAGNDWTVKFSRPDELLIYVEVTLIKDPDTYPLDGDDQVIQAIVDFGDAQRAGKDVVASSLVAQCFAITGVLDVTSLFIDVAPAPGASTTIDVDLRELAVFDTSRVTVITSDGDP